MKRYLALLRGINVGGIRVPMPELKQTFERLGHRNVKTFLQTGNVVFDSPEIPGTMKPSLEAELSQTFDYEAFVLLYEWEALGPIAAGYPFPRDGEHHAYVVFVGDPVVFAALEALASASGEPTAPGPGVLYWKVKRGDSTETPLAKILAQGKYKAATTIRNLNTLERVLAEYE